MKNVVLAVLLLLGSLKLMAGYDVSVCDSVDQKGNCINKSDIFHFTGDRMKLQVAVHNKDMLNTSKILFKVYLMKNDNDGDIYAELSSYTKPEWFGVVKKLYFVKPGYYRIDVLKADKSQISSTFITISDR